ncbi:MAG: 5-oxoprolinase subunit PxpB [Chitinophagaceae bacterium]
MEGYRIYSLNEQSLTIEFGQEISPAVNDRVMAMHHDLQKKPFQGYIESVPAYTTLTVYYDLLMMAGDNKKNNQSASQFVSGILSERISTLASYKEMKMPVLELPVCYDLSLAPDLPWVAAYCRLSIPEIIALHTQWIYRVYMIGFIPGFPYLGLLPPALEVPRKLRPVMAVPAGSVALAGRQTGIYPFTIPGGWQIIGRTHYRLFDVNKEPSCSLESGQQIRLVSISLDEFNQQS